MLIILRRIAGPERGRHHVPLQRLLGEGLRQPVRPLRQEGVRRLQGGSL